MRFFQIHMNLHMPQSKLCIESVMSKIFRLDYIWREIMKNSCSNGAGLTPDVWITEIILAVNLGRWWSLWLSDTDSVLFLIETIQVVLFLWLMRLSSCLIIYSIHPALCTIDKAFSEPLILHGPLPFWWALYIGLGLHAGEPKPLFSRRK